MENHRTLVLAEQKLEGDSLMALLKNVDWMSLNKEAICISKISEQIFHHRPDLIVININNGDAKFIQQFSLVKGKFPNTKIFVIAMSNNVYLISQLLKLGAAGYFLKTASQEELFDALNCVMNNEVYLPDDISKKLVRNFIDQHQQGINTCQDGSCLTKREHDILKLLINAESSAQIADELFISELTVNTHRKHILKKMGFNSTASLIKYALENGIV